MPGRLYVTEHFLCFNAHLLGFEKKVSQQVHTVVLSHLRLFVWGIDENRDRAHPEPVEEQATAHFRQLDHHRTCTGKPMQRKEIDI